MTQSPIEELDALVIGAGVTGLYQLYCLLQLGLEARIYEAGAGVGRHLVLESLPGRATGLRELDLRLLVLRGAARGMDMDGELSSGNRSWSDT